VSLLPTPTVEYHFNWDAPDYGPACLTYGAESLRAHASYIEVSFPQHCRPDSVDDAVWEAVGEVVNK